LNTWAHLAVTYDGAWFRLFVNGVEVDALAVSGDIGVNDGALWIGGAEFVGDEFFKGYIDELRIYNRALTAQQIQADMRTPVVGGGYEGLVAAFGFEEASGEWALDASGWGNDGVIEGAERTEGGYFGRAMAFDGVDDWVRVADADSLDLTSGMTLEAWVLPTGDAGSWGMVLSKETTDRFAYGLYNNAVEPGPSSYARIGQGYVSIRRDAKLALNTWAHLAVTYDGAWFRLFVNGVEVDALAVSGDIGVNDGALRIGGAHFAGDEFFTGYIDEVRIYDRALTVQQIQADMRAPVIGF
jgi:hypothetical protein